MALLEFGGAHGLAYRENYQEDIQNSLALKQMQRQANIDAENRVKLLGTTQYADTSRMNDWDAKQVTDYSHKVSDQIGSLIAEHPDITRDPVAYNELTRLRGQMLDNDYVRHGMQMTSMIDQFNKYRATTPGTDDLPEMQKMTADLKRYTDTGTIDPTGREKIPFQFADPLETFDMGGDLTNRAKVLGKVSEWDPSANNGIGGIVETNVPEETLRAEAQNIAHVYKDAPKYRVMFNKLSPTEQSYYGVNNSSDATRYATMDQSMENWIYHGLKERTDQKIQPIRVGQPRTNSRGTTSSDMGYSPFVSQIQSFPRNVINNNANIEKLSPVVKVGDQKQLIPSEPLKMLLDDGKSKNWVTLNSYSGIPLKAEETGNFMNDSHGRTMLEYTVRMPVKLELSNGNTPLLKSKRWFNDPRDYKAGDYEELPATQSVLRLEHDKRPGKETELTGYVNGKVWYPAVTDSSHTASFDKFELGQKDANSVRPVRQIGENQNSYQMVFDNVEEGQEFLFPSGTYVKRGNELVPKK